MNGVVTVALTVVVSNLVFFFLNKTGNSEAIKKKIDRSDCIGKKKILWSLEDKATKSNEKRQRENIGKMDRGAWWAEVLGVARSRT